MSTDTTHILITVEGEVQEHNEPVSVQQTRNDLGGWWDWVPLRHVPVLMAFVSDDEHQTGLPYNLVGTVATFILGAHTYPLAGPVIITGWGPDRVNITGTEILPEVLTVLTAALTSVRQALWLEPGEPATGPAWAAEVRAVATELMDMGLPGLTTARPAPLPRRRPYEVYTGSNGEPYILGADVEDVVVDLGTILGERNPS